MNKFNLPQGLLDSVTNVLKTNPRDNTPLQEKLIKANQTAVKSASQFDNAVASIVAEGRRKEAERQAKFVEAAAKTHKGMGKSIVESLDESMHVMPMGATRGTSSVESRYKQTIAHAKKMGYNVHHEEHKGEKSGNVGTPDITVHYQRGDERTTADPEAIEIHKGGKAAKDSALKSIVKGKSVNEEAIIAESAFVEIATRMKNVGSARRMQNMAEQKETIAQMTRTFMASFDQIVESNIADMSQEVILALAEVKADIRTQMLHAVNVASAARVVDESAKIMAIIETKTALKKKSNPNTDAYEVGNLKTRHGKLGSDAVDEARSDGTVFDVKVAKTFTKKPGELTGHESKKTAKGTQFTKKLDAVGKEDADVNNDGKTDSSDAYLKKRRAAISANIKEEEQIDEKDIGKHNNATTGFKAMVKKLTPKYGAEGAAKIAGSQMKKVMGEEAEQIDELSIDGMNNYRKAAKADADAALNKTDPFTSTSAEKKTAMDHMNKRMRGVAKAGRKIMLKGGTPSGVKEEVTNEGVMAKVKSFVKKGLEKVGGGTDADQLNRLRSNMGMDVEKLKKNTAMDVGGLKKRLAKEEVEIVDESKAPEGLYSSKRFETDSQRVARLAKEKRQAVKNTDTPGNSYKHQCAIHVKHSKLGEGKTLYSQHAQPDADGHIAWYDVMFEEGIKRVDTTDLEILESEMHGNHKKK